MNEEQYVSNRSVNNAKISTPDICFCILNIHMLLAAPFAISALSKTHYTPLGGYVFGRRWFVCLAVSLSVNNFAQKVLTLHDEFFRDKMSCVMQEKR